MGHYLERLNLNVLFISFFILFLVLNSHFFCFYFARTNRCCAAFSLPLLFSSLQLDDLPIIHVAGTKGKGSTCAFAERALRECGLRTALFTSPHLISECERFRLDGAPISRELFVQSFWAVWRRLEATAADDDARDLPAWFRYMTLLAFYIFKKANVDVAIIEVISGVSSTSFFFSNLYFTFVYSMEGWRWRSCWCNEYNKKSVGYWRFLFGLRSYECKFVVHCKYVLFFYLINSLTSFLFHIFRF